MGTNIIDSNFEVLRLENISKLYKQSEGVLEVIKDSSLSIKNGELVSFVGPSGCGKTTLLQICGLLDSPTSGDIYIKIGDSLVRSDIFLGALHTNLCDVGKNSAYSGAFSSIREIM